MPTLYKILNVQYPNQLADLIHAKSTGPVQGHFANTDSNNQSWEIVSIGANLVNIQNASTGSYASVSSEYDGANIVGSRSPYVWQQLFVADGAYQIVTQDGNYVWRLTGRNDYAPITLHRRVYEGQDAQWVNEPTQRVE